MKKIDVVIGGPYSSGVLAGGTHFEYAPASPEILAKVKRINSICEEYRVSIKAAALHFSLAHPASAAIIPGASKPERIAEDHAALREKVPSEFWRDLRKQGLVAPNAPLPIDRGEPVAQASASVDIAASPDEVWQLIGGFGSLPKWLPYIPKSELSDGGRVRHLATPKGETIVERLEEFDNARRSYSYSIVQAPFPVTDYLSTLLVEARDGGSRVEWSGEFRPRGTSAEEASRLFQVIFDDGLKALASRFAPKTRRAG